MRIGYARVSTAIAARLLFGLAAAPAAAIALMWSKADVIGLKIVWFHSHVMWF